MPSNPLRIGVLLVQSIQLLDLAPLDLLFMSCPWYLNELGLPKPLVDLGRPCEIYYIGIDGVNAQCKITSQTSVPITNSFNDTAVAPGNLDILYLPGPPPKSMPPAEEYLNFLREHNAVGTQIITICTAALIVAYAGIAKGKTATAPRFLIPQLRKQFPDVKHWDDSVRYTRDGNLWMSGTTSIS